MCCYPWDKMLIQKGIDLKLQFHFIALDCEFYVLNFISLICISPLCPPQLLGIFVCMVREAQTWVGWSEFTADVGGGIGIFLLCGIYLGCNPQLWIYLMQHLNYPSMLLFCGLLYSCTQILKSRTGFFFLHMELIFVVVMIFSSVLPPAKYYYCS